MTPPIKPTVVSQEQQIEAPQKQFVLPQRFVGKFAKLDTTPSVKNVERWVCQNVVPVNITTFRHGAEGQKLELLGDGQTTIVNGVKIKTNTGANKLLLAAKTYMFTMFNTVWIETA